jgi:thioredoxin 1
MTVTEINDKPQFDGLVKDKQFVVVQAHATWCGPCKAISPFFEKHSNEYEEIADKYAFVRFDTDEVPDLAQELGIRSIPAFFLFENGELSEKLAGANPPALKKLIDSAGQKAKGPLKTDEDF